jgi:negative regulator of sigma-B (phosphoserine phosphatase)
MPRKKNIPEALLDCGVAGAALPGQAVSGDRHLIQPFADGVLVAVADGLGHGPEASVAAELAVDVLKAHAHESVLSLLNRCHEALRETRGVVLTLASVHPLDDTITWVGVGNVEGKLLRADAKGGPTREYVLLHGGVVGLQLPPLRGMVLPVRQGDLLILATDGIRSGYAAELPLDEAPQRLADRILARNSKGTDDALVVVARYQGGRP